jgi:hypothetical protein
MFVGRRSDVVGRLRPTGNDRRQGFLVLGGNSPGFEDYWKILDLVLGLGSLFFHKNQDLRPKTKDLIPDLAKIVLGGKLRPLL